MNKTTGETTTTATTNEMSKTIYLMPPKLELRVKSKSVEKVKEVKEVEKVSEEEAFDMACDCAWGEVRKYWYGSGLNDESFENSDFFEMLTENEWYIENLLYKFEDEIIEEGGYWEAEIFNIGDVVKDEKYTLENLMELMELTEEEKNKIKSELKPVEQEVKQEKKVEMTEEEKERRARIDEIKAEFRTKIYG